MALFMAIRARKNYRRKIEIDREKYYSLFRFNFDQIKYLSDTFLNANNENRGGKLDNMSKMKIFLRYVSDPGFQIGVGEDFGVHQGTVSRTVLEVSRCISAKADQWIKFPQTQADFKKENREWEKRFNLPKAISAIDCTHVKIRKPKVQPDEYINRKGCFTLNIQATVNAKEEITSVDIRWPGSTHDSRILRNSQIFEVMNNAHGDFVILGDQGYGIRTWLMVPFSNPNSRKEKRFNKLHKKERVIIERVFGQIKQKFPILQYKVRIKTENVPLLVLSCFVLHNVSKYFDREAERRNKKHNESQTEEEDDEQEEEEEEEVDDDDSDEEEEEQEEDVRNENEARTRRLGQLKRQQIADLL